MVDLSDRPRLRKAITVFVIAFAFYACLRYEVQRAREPRGPAPQVVRADPVSITLFVVSVALSILATQLLAPKTPGLLRDDKPTTISTRGAFVPWVIGVARVGPVFCWAGKRSTRKESTGGGKGGGGKEQKQRIYFEQGWHVLTCNGPVSRLRRITQNGKVIFKGPIDPTTHPSGSSVDLGKEGTFRIFWGEGDQPANDFLGDSTRVGIESRWPFICYIEWRPKRLGTQALWPLLDYEIEVRPFDSQLVSSSPWLAGSRTLGDRDYDVHEVTNGVAGVATITVTGRAKKFIQAGGFIQLVGNTGLGSTVDLRVRSATNTTTISFPFVIYRCEIILDEELVGATDDGVVTPYVEDENDGANPAHLLDSILFQQFPHGAGNDRSEWDVPSLEQLGILAESEGLKMRAFATEGDTVEAVVASLMQDTGFLLPIDPLTGLYRAMPLRAEDPAAIPELTDEQLLPPLMEREILLEEVPIDRAIYTFSDRTRGFRTNTVPFDDDGQAQQAGRPRQQTIQLASVVDNTTASTVAERRAQEDGAGNGRFKVNATREARRLIPGMAFRIAGVVPTLRCMSVEPDPDSGKTIVEAILDNYGVERSSYSNPDTAGLPEDADIPENDVGVAFLEVPPYLFVGKKMVGAVLRRRAADDVSRSLIHLSADGTTYFQVATEFDIHTGGTLDEAMIAGAEFILDQGPTITVDNPDIASVLDLSADLVNWRLGRQLVQIGTELFFLQKVTALGGDQYRLDGLMRARLGTDQEAHAVGDDVFIFTDDGLESWEDPLLSPEATRFFKSQPIAGESLPLDEVDEHEVTLYGKGLRPPPPVNLRVVGNCNAYVSGDVAHQWTHRSATDPGTGAGEQDAGNPTSDGTVDGAFIVRIKNAGGSTVRTEAPQTTSTYTYTSANRTTDGLSGSNYRIAVSQIAGGYESSEVEVLVLKVT